MTVYSVKRLVLFSLAAEAPAELGLPPLRTQAESADLVRRAIARFLAPDGDVFSVSRVEELPLSPAPEDGATVVYLVGHAWQQAGRYTTTVREGERMRVVDGDALLALLRRILPAEAPVVLLVDTCNAEGLASALGRWLQPHAIAVFSSAIGEEAIEMPADRATRFALHLAEGLRTVVRSPGVDVIALALAVQQDLESPGVLAPQSVRYWLRGGPVLLAAGGSTSKQEGRRGSRTYRLVRGLLVTAGSALALAAVAAIAYWRSHLLVVLEFGDFAQVTTNAVLEVRREAPDSNSSSIVRRIVWRGDPNLRLRVPATNLLFVIDARYRDGRPRAIRFHHVAVPGFRSGAKHVRLVLPPADEVARHPDMAFVPPTRWLKGERRESREHPTGFWIDLRPPTVHEYLPILQRALHDGRLTQEQTVLVTSFEHSAALDATGTRKVRDLASDVSGILGVLDRESRAEASRYSAVEPESAGMPGLDQPCAECPAPMTRAEAEYYCHDSGKRLSTDLEWELAARGSDGRAYPWGNNFDGTRANCSGLPGERGIAARLAPVDSFPRGMSPFGLVDVVGNAGDWVAATGPYEATYRGGTHLFNPIDCRVDKEALPSTASMQAIRITARCVRDRR